MRLKLFAMVGLALLGFTSLTALLLPFAPAKAAPEVPDGPHCIGTGPIALDPEYCGCTWGGVYYRGKPVLSAPVSLAFGAQSTTQPTKSGVAEIYPFYVLTGTLMGAQLNDVMTVTTELGGVTSSRSFRARPDASGEQQVPLVVPEPGEWQPWLSAGYTRTLAVSGGALWAGGPGGLLRIDLASGTAAAQTLPWGDPSVVAVASGPSGWIWAAGPRNLAVFDGTGWIDVGVPFSSTIRSLAVEPLSGILWLGGGDTQGSLAVYAAQWKPVTAVAEPVTALAVDGSGYIWAGTWGGGAYRHNMQQLEPNQGWTQYTTATGLVSDYVYAIAADGDAVWFGTRGYKVNGTPRGGISRYSPAGGTWHSYGIGQGLPADPAQPDTPASIVAVAGGGDGLIWAAASAALGGSSNDSIYVLAAPDLWLEDVARTNARVNALAATGKLVFAARTTGAERLDRSSTVGTPPEVLMPTSALTITLNATAIFTATASDADEGGGSILGWEWTSDRAGPLCTTAERCDIPAQLLGEGVHYIRLRVQDDEGMWSQAQVREVTVVRSSPGGTSKSVWLPLVVH